MAVSDHVSALHRAPYVPYDTIGARRSIRVLITRHTGVSRHFPCPIKHRVQIPCEICLVLLRISTQIVKKRSARNGSHRRIERGTTPVSGDAEAVIGRKTSRWHPLSSYDGDGGVKLRAGAPSRQQDPCRLIKCVKRKPLHDWRSFRYIC